VCYRCEICTEVVPHRTPLKRKIIYRKVQYRKPRYDLDEGYEIRTREEIAREVKICERCQYSLKYVSLDQLVKQHYMEKESKPLASIIKAPPPIMGKAVASIPTKVVKGLIPPKALKKSLK
jgi:hypothetical protein